MSSPPQTIQAVFDAVKAKLTSASHELGAEKVELHGAPPRIVWVPGEDSFDGDPKGGTNPRALWEVAEGFNVVVWGSSYDATRELRSAFVRALHSVAAGSYRLTKGAWPDGNAGLVRSGRVYVLSLSLLIPITRDPLPTARPAGVLIRTQVNP